MLQRLRVVHGDELKRVLSGKVYADEMEIGANPDVDIRTFFYREQRKKDKKKLDNTRPIFGMIEAGQAHIAKPTLGKKAQPGGQLLLFDVENKSADVLKHFLYNCTDPFETELYTDGWSSYSKLRHIFKEHYVCDRKKYGKYDFKRYYRRVRPDTHKLATDDEIATGNFEIITTNPIENVWSHVQLEYLRFYGYSQEYAQLYLNEFMFRFNHRHLEISELFEILVKRCCNTPLYKRVGEKRKKILLQPEFTWRKKKGSEDHKWTKRRKD
jgi:hypothetical protein